MWPQLHVLSRENRTKIEPKNIPSCLIPLLLVIFTRHLEILVISLNFLYLCNINFLLFCGSSTLSHIEWWRFVRALTFDSVDKIYWCDQSDETSLAMILHEAIFQLAWENRQHFVTPPMAKNNLRKLTPFSWCHHRFPCEMAFEKRVQKFHTDDPSPPRSCIKSTAQIWIISMKCLGFLLRRHFVLCFLRLFFSQD